MNKALQVIIICLVCLLITGFLATPVSAQAGVLFVSPSGDDANNCLTEATACLTVNAAIGKAAEGDTINVLPGTYQILASTDRILLNKANITISGAGAGSTIFETQFAASYVFYVTANGVTLNNLEIHKLDKAGNQNLVYVQADSFTLSNSLLYGDYVFGDPEVSRGMEVAYGSDTMTITGNTFHHLRQPGYLNGSLAAPTTGTIANNLVYATRGWVIAGANMAFSGNTWTSGGEVNVFDVAILSDTPAAYYTNLIAVSEANNDSVIEDQRVSPALLTVVYVDDSALPGGNGGPSAPYQAIQTAVSRAMPGGKILVAAGQYLEEVNVNKVGVRLIGSGYQTTVLMGRKDAGGANTLTIGANNVTVTGFTVTRDGNNPTDWGTNVKTQGVIFSQGTTGSTLRDCLITGNRNGVYLNNTQNNTITNNIIDFNRTGMQLANNVTGTVITQNQITNNWTLGILLNFDTGSLYTTSMTISNNAIDGNWYSGIESRWQFSRITNASGNWFGTTNPVKTGVNSAEPGYADLIPTLYGGSSVPPTASPDISGTYASKVDYTPWLGLGTDTDSVAMGFQGDFSNLWVDDNSTQSGTAGRVHEAVNSVTSGGTVQVLPGIFEEQVTITQPLTLIGSGVGQTILHAPPIESRTTRTVAFSGYSRSFDYVIGAFSADPVTITDITVDGLKRGANTCIAGVRAAGIAMINSSGLVEDVRILNTSQPQNAIGCQDGSWQSLLAASAVADGLNTVTGRNLDVETFQKNGLTAWSDGVGGLQVTFENCTIASNPTGLTAQNGIQLSFGAGGTLRGNTISGVYYLGDYWTASGILVYNASAALVEQNTLINNQSNIVVQDGPATIDSNTITASLPAGVMNAYSGIMVVDPPGFVPSPSETNTIIELLPAPIGIMALTPIQVIVSDNDIYGGNDSGAFAGIEAYSGYGTFDVSVLATGNDISGWQNGIYAGECASDCEESMITSFVAHHNRIVGNITGATGEMTTTINVENNWWGCNEGPGETGCDPVTGNADFDPWLVLTLQAEPLPITSGQMVTLTASLNTNSAGADTSTAGYVPDGYPVAFTVDTGTVSVTPVNMMGGNASTQWTLPTATQPTAISVTATYDNGIAIFQTLLNSFAIWLPLIFR
ncbi:MAG: right-handed parallel beta-helix repeat-containing protein [Anaerolineaceae bacterium]|nr:right-handed parallel beta-helix repeat-containing protein [Anaerolineaceae bacterium]